MQFWPFPTFLGRTGGPKGPKQPQTGRENVCSGPPVGPGAQSEEHILDPLFPLFGSQNGEPLRLFRTHRLSKQPLHTRPWWSPKQSAHEGGGITPDPPASTNLKPHPPTGGDACCHSQQATAVALTNPASICLGVYGLVRGPRYGHMNVPEKKGPTGTIGPKCGSLGPHSPCNQTW